MRTFFVYYLSSLFLRPAKHFRFATANLASMNYFAHRRVDSFGGSGAEENLDLSDDITAADEARGETGFCERINDSSSQRTKLDSLKLRPKDASSSCVCKHCLGVLSAAFFECIFVNEIAT